MVLHSPPQRGTRWEGRGAPAGLLRRHRTADTPGAGRTRRWWTRGRRRPSTGADSTLQQAARATWAGHEVAQRGCHRKPNDYSFNCHRDTSGLCFVPLHALPVFYKYSLIYAQY